MTQAPVMQVIQQIKDVPPFTEVINSSGGYTRYQEHRNYVAILVDLPDGLIWHEVVTGKAEIKPDAHIICTGRFHDAHHTVLSSIMADLRKHARIHLPLVATANIIDALHNQDRLNKREDDTEAMSKEENSEIIRSFDAICQQALAQNASDIHFQINDEGSRANIKFRVNGGIVMHTDMTRNRAIQLVRTAYTSLADPDSRNDSYSERDYQDCAIDRVYREGRVRMRYASSPTAPDGTDVVLRLLPIGLKDNKRLRFEDLGYDAWHANEIARAFARSQGITIIAGTTGSGKSTTLKHAIEGIAIERSDAIIRTIEQPVEYEIRGARQSSVVPKKDGSGENPFARAIRSAMRQDPDVLMIGEIRDEQTADLAVLAVRSGHQAMSTIHAESALNIIDRLNGLGIKRDDLASPGLISGLAYQRLMPTLCPHCRIPMQQTEDSLPEHTPIRSTLERLQHLLGKAHSSCIYFRNHKGCPHCSRGKLGRTLCAEVIRPSLDILEAIRTGDSISAFRVWRGQIVPGRMDHFGGRTAFEHGLTKMIAGKVCPADIEHGFNWLDEDNAMEWFETSGTWELV